MQVKEIKKEGLTHEMEVTLPASDIEKRIETRLREIAKNIRVPGFRPGKAPMDLLKQRYGKGVMGEVLDVAVNDSITQALKEKNIKPAMRPKVEVKSFDHGKDLTFTMAIEALPEITIKDFKGIEIKKLVAIPEGKSVDEALENLAKNRRDTKIAEGRAAKSGDLVVIDFSGRTADDNKEHPGMSANGHRLELGSGSFIPGFEDQLIGAKTGEKVEVKLGFPADYGAAELAGREAIFDVTVNEIREYVDAKIDDEFAKSFGKDSLAALKEAVQEQLQKEMDYQTRLHMKKGLMDALDAAYDFEIPPGMLEMEFKNIMDQLELDRRRNPEKLEGDDEGVSEDDKAEFRSIAERRVRLGLILSEIGSKNNIQVTDPELQRAVIMEAQKYPGQERQVFDFYAKNRNALESMRAPIFEDKVVDYMLALATITEKSVTPDELMKAIEAEEEEAEKSEKKEKSSSKKKK
jgi:trigger factor